VRAAGDAGWVQVPEGHVGGQDVVRVAVEVVTGPVVPHRGAGIGVTGGDLHVAQAAGYPWPGLFIAISRYSHPLPAESVRARIAPSRWPMVPRSAYTAAAGSAAIAVARGRGLASVPG